MKYKVINIESWKLNDQNAPDVMNDVTIELNEKVARRGMDFGALEPVDDFLEELEEVEKEEKKLETVENQCTICGKICKSKAGLITHMRSHKSE